VASVQTIGRNKKQEDGSWEYCKRIQKFDAGRFKYVLVDEAHHAIGASYQGVLAYFNVLKSDPQRNDPAKFCLGVTATPERADNIGLETLFDTIIATRDLRELISEGWLATPKAYRIDTHVDLSGVDSKYGDFVTKQLEKAVNTPERNRQVVQEYITHGEGMKAIAFTVDVQHTVDLAAAFREEGILAYGITGDTPTGDENTPNTRKWVYKRYADGGIQVLVSCNVLQEGFDQPIASVGLMARPTKSGLLYRQMCGRVLRPYPAPEEIEAMLKQGITPKWIKPYCIILDFADLSSRHTLHTLPTLFGLRADYNAKGGKVVDQVQEMERIVQQKKLALDLSDVRNLAELKSIAERVDLFQKPVIPEEVQKYSKLAWYKAGANAYQIVLDKEVFRVQETGLGKWKVSKSVKGVRTEIGEYATKSEAFSTADGHVPADQAFKVQAAAKWRSKPVTDGQVDLMWKVDKKIKPMFRHISDPKKAKEAFAKALREKYTSGDVSLLLDQALPRVLKHFRK
jgi:ATP-dependent helicase IRC3